MDKYYYLASQLPLLNFNHKTYIDREYFLAEAEKWLAPVDYVNLCSATINNFEPQAGDSRLLRDYKDFEKVLRKELSLARKASGSKIDYQKTEILKPAFLEGNPLEVEVRLLLLRWQFIEEKEKDNYFNLDFLICYFLKLQVLERLFTFDKVKGTASFDSLCAASSI